jgi:tetratricopeptide (TPR) repeat protein
LTGGFQAQSRGNLAAAEEAYRSVLADEPDNVNALQLLGLVCLNTDRRAEAEDRLSRALELCPHVAELHHNRGLCRLAQERLAEAETDFCAAIRIKPAYPEAFNNLGLVARKLGRFGDAEAAFIRAIRLRPDFAIAFTNLAAAVRAQGRAEAAEACCRRALELDPESFQTEAQLGLALQDLSRFDEAEASFRRSLALQPLAETWISLGRLLRISVRAERTERTAEVEECFRRAVALDRNVVEGYRELGFALLERGKLDDAETVARKAVELDGGASEGHRLLGRVFRSRGRLPEAEACGVRAVELDRGNAEAHRDLAEVHLLTGRWASGWKGYEWRLRCRDAPRGPFTRPLWDGSALDGKTVLLWAEPRLDETLQFLRYVPRVKARAGGGRVILRGPAGLEELLGSETLGADQILSDGQPLPAFDTHAPLTSLPGIFATTPDTVPIEVLSIKQTPVAGDFWRERLKRLSGLRVGILWKSDRGADDGGRSVDLTACAPLCRVPGVNLVSLQKGERPTNDRLGVVDLGREYDAATWTDVAAIVAGLDLVIGVDSTIVHLAGVLGVPVWVALPFAPDWRWLLGRAVSPWYPAMRLFRQPAPGEWDAVFQRLAWDLERWAISLRDLERWVVALPN